MLCSGALYGIPGYCSFIYICAGRNRHLQTVSFIYLHLCPNSITPAHPSKSSNPPEVGFCWAGDEALLLEAPHRLAIVFSRSISAIVFFPAAVEDLLPPADESEVFQRSSKPPNPAAELLGAGNVAGFEATFPKLLGLDVIGGAPPNAPNPDDCWAGLVGESAGATTGRWEAAGTVLRKSKTLPPTAGLAAVGAGADEKPDVGAA